MNSTRIVKWCKFLISMRFLLESWKSEFFISDLIGIWNFIRDLIDALQNFHYTCLIKSECLETKNENLNRNLNYVRDFTGSRILTWTLMEIRIVIKTLPEWISVWNIWFSANHKTYLKYEFHRRFDRIGCFKSPKSILHKIHQSLKSLAKV